MQVKEPCLILIFMSFNVIILFNVLLFSFSFESLLSFSVFLIFGPRSGVEIADYDFLFS